ncbi:NADH dehydrogenase (ubiquinone) complex I, assembly factor 6, partial [Zancudomyces culisetae]
MYAGLFHIYFELLGVRNYHCDNAARLISKAYNIILLLREICKFEAGKNVASAHGSRGDAGVNDNSNIAMLEFLTSNNDNLGAGNIKDSKSGKSGNDIKRDDDLIYELASTAFTRLCGVKEVYLPHSPKQSYPAYLSMVPLLSWLEQLEKHNFNIRNKKLLLSSFSLPIKL